MGAGPAPGSSRRGPGCPGGGVRAEPIGPVGRRGDLAAGPRFAPAAGEA